MFAILTQFHVCRVRPWYLAVVHNERSAFYRERFLKLYPVRQSDDTRP
jgi:hypothetical protein